MKIRVDYLAGSFAIYIGYAQPGTAESASLWRIAKFTYDVNDNITAVDFAGGNAGFVNKWTDRTTYTYS